MVGVGWSDLEWVGVVWSGLEWVGVVWSGLERNSIKPFYISIFRNNYSNKHFANLIKSIRSAFVAPTKHLDQFLTLHKK